jgi:tetratricopeptide (TPR) repeat protein
VTDETSSRVDLNTISNSTLTIDRLAGRDIRETHFHLPDSLELTGSRLAPRNPLFVGRESTLTQLAERLNGDGSLVVLAGYGGLGKTQTAVEFGHRFASHFPGGVFFLNCARADSVASEVADCGSEGRVNFPGYDGLPLPQQLALVQREWAKAIPRLIIMDNAEEAEIIKQWRPASGGCRLLVTARRATWPPTLTSNLIHLPPLARPDSLKLLAQGSEAFAHDSAANEIAGLLGDLPLALHCAGAYIAHYGQPPAAYLAELKAKASTLQHESLGDWLAQHESLPTGHTPNVIATFELSYQALISNSKLQTPNREAQSEFEVGSLKFVVEIFHLLAHCAPAAPLPRAVLTSALKSISALSGGRSEAKPEVEERGADTTQPAPEVSARQLTDALRALSNVGLIDLDGQLQPLIHRLPQEFARLRAADPDADAARMEEVVGEMATQINKAGLPEAMKPLRDHLQALAERAEARGSENAGRLFNSLGYHLHTIADYAAARAAFERALTIDEKAFGHDHPNVAIRVNNLGGVYQDLGDLPAARAAFERALAIDEKVVGAEHPNVATLVNNLGLVYKDLGDLPAARAAFERALTIDEKAFGPDHPNIARDVNNLGAVYQDLGDLPAARAAYERALTIDEKAFGPDHPQVAIFVNNLGMVYQALGDLPTARTALERALTIDEKAFGPDHPNVAIRVNNLGSVYQDLGDLPAARAAFERALTIFEKVLGAEHPNVATLVNNLGLVYKALGDLPAARAALERALTIFEKVLGAEHPNVATLVNNLGGVYQALGDLPAARAAYERALRIMEKYAPDNPNTKIFRKNLARVVKEMEG